MRLFLFLFCSFFQLFSQDDFYKKYEGTLGGDPVVVHLYKSDNQLMGHYYYTAHQKPIDFKADLNLDKPTNTHWSLKIKGKKLNGWRHIKADGDKLVAHEVTGEPIKFSYMAVQGRTDRNAKAKTVGAQYNAKSIWPAGNSPLIDTIRWHIAGFFYESCCRKCRNKVSSNFTDIQNWLLVDKKVHLQKETYAKRSPYMSDSYCEKSAHVVFSSPTFISISLECRSYSQGTRDHYVGRFITFDLVNKRVLTFEDIFITPDKQHLEDVLAKALRSEYLIPDDMSLKSEGFYESELTKHLNNFFVTGKGIGFDYGAGEIACYAAGPTTLFIPFNELEGMLQPDFKKLAEG